MSRYGGCRCIVSLSNALLAQIITRGITVAPLISLHRLVVLVQQFDTGKGFLAVDIFVHDESRRLLVLLREYLGASQVLLFDFVTRIFDGWRLCLAFLVIGNH